MHTAFGPSSLSKRCRCPGSYHEEYGITPDEREDASEGSALHAIIEAIISGKEVEVPEKIRWKIEFCLDAISKSLAGDEIIPGEMRTVNGGSVYLEMEMDHLPYSVYTNEVGTCDFVVVYDDHIVLLDWKFGGHYVDHPNWNHQMKGYALGLWERFGLIPIHVGIVQPSVSDDYQFAPWIYNVEQYVEFNKELGSIVENSLVPNAPRVAGPSCVFCNARKTCAARTSVYSVYGSGLSIREAFDAADNEGRSILITQAKIAIDVAEDLIEHAKKRIKEGWDTPVGYRSKVTAKGNIQLNPTDSIVPWSPDGAAKAPIEIIEPKFPEVEKWKI